MLYMPETGDIYQGELHKGSGSKPRERIMLQATKLKGQSCLHLLVSDMELQDLEVCLSRFQFCLGLVFLYYTLIPSL